jgi:hypothetical protein
MAEFGQNRSETGERGRSGEHQKRDRAVTLIAARWRIVATDACAAAR